MTFPITTPELKCYFQGEGSDVDILCSLTIPSKNISNFPLMVSIETVTPAYSWQSHQTGNVEQLFFNGQPGIAYYGTVHNNGSQESESGIWFIDCKAQTPASFVIGGDVGEVNLTQIVKYSAWWKSSSGTSYYANWNANKHGGGYGLDLDFPYPIGGMNGTDPCLWPANNSSFIASDPPGLFATNPIEAYLKPEFVIYLLYKPPGTASVWVPLSSISWNCFGHRNFETQSWIGRSKQTNGPMSFPPHPKWTYKIDQSTAGFTQVP